MLTVHYAAKMGKITVRTHKGNGKQRLGIYHCNGLAAIVTDPHTDSKGQTVRTLWAALFDSVHLNRCLGLVKGYDDIFKNDIVAIKLNTYWPAAITMLKAFTKAGYEVRCYYAKPKSLKSCC